MQFPESVEACPFGFTNRFSTKSELIEEIGNIGNSVAAVLCNISREVPFQDPGNNLMKDIIGVVALLGSVHSFQLSRSNPIKTLTCLSFIFFYFLF